MEIPGFITLLYIMTSLPKELGLTEPLPWGNWTMAGMFVGALPLPRRDLQQFFSFSPPFPGRCPTRQTSPAAAAAAPSLESRQKQSPTD